MKNDVLITFVGVNSEEGKVLAKSFEQLNSIEFQFQLNILFEPTINENMAALLQSDIVIIDGSIELGNNYDNATLGPLVLDYVWLVSRTYLPTNYKGIIEGGYPKYIPPKNDKSSNSKIIFSNSEILKWLKSKIYSSLNFLPREGKGSYIRYFKDIASVTGAISEKRKEKFQIFISYRSKNYDIAKKLKEEIENTSNKNKFGYTTSKKVYLVPPGELVYRDELLTEFKRWQIQCLVRDYIETCEEFWILKDENDDYFQSWWTQGELVSLAYRDQVDKIKVYSIKEDKLINTPSNYKINLSENQKTRLGRWYSNTDPVLMNASARYAMRLWKNVPLIGKISYFSDHVWSDEFWENPAFNCSVCANQKPRVNKLNVDYFLWLQKHNDLVFLSPIEAQKAIKEKKLNCPRCGTSFNVIEEAPRYTVYYDKALREANENPSSLIEEKVYRIQLNKNIRSEKAKQMGTSLMKEDSLFAKEVDELVKRLK